MLAPTKAPSQLHESQHFGQTRFVNVEANLQQEAGDEQADDEDEHQDGQNLSQHQQLANQPS